MSIMQVRMYIATVQLKGNLIPAHGQQVKHLRVILVTTVTSMQEPVTI